MSLKKDEILSFFGAEKYVLALSGGLDSVVLLDILTKAKVVVFVAHLNHGIREESSWDMRFCAELAQCYGLEFHSKSLKLGPKASESLAREKRYGFLEEIMKKTNSTAIITAHHQDDYIETGIMNLFRGTGWRGLVSLKSTPERIRPLLNTTKAELYEYALEHNLEWLEDSTNQDTRYTRNLIRLKILPLLKHRKEDFLSIQNGLEVKSAEIEQLLDELIKSLFVKNKLNRTKFIKLPLIIRREAIHSILRKEKVDMSRIGQADIKKIEHFICTAKPTKFLHPTKNAKLKATKSHIHFNIA